jgi:uncharacterized protein YfdQ (DUF2303 family)
MDNIPANLLEIIKDARQNALLAREIDVEGVPYLITPAGTTATQINLKDLVDKIEAASAHPRRIRESRKFVDVESLDAYVSKFFDGQTTLAFGSISQKTCTVCFDYHDTASHEPSWCTHTATLVADPTPEWSALRSFAGKWMTQVEMAEFIDRWDFLAIEPPAAHLAELAVNLAGTVTGNFKAQIRRESGTATFSWDEQTDTGQIRVPTKIKVGVAPFYFADVTEMDLIFRFRIHDGKPQFQFDNRNAGRVEYIALKKIFDEVEAATSLKVMVQP